MTLLVLKSSRAIACTEIAAPIFVSILHTTYHPYMLSRLGLRTAAFARPGRVVRLYLTFGYVQDWPELKTRIAEAKKEEFNQVAVDAFKQALRLHQRARATNDGDFTDAANKPVLEIVDTLFPMENKAQFSPQLLRDLLLQYPPTPVALHLIRTYYTHNPEGTTIDKDTALIALRTALWNADFDNAIKVTDVTVGHPLYVAKKNQILKKGFIKLVATLLGVTLFSKFGVDWAIDAGVLLDLWRHLSAINLMLLTYIINLSFFVTIVQFGRQLSALGGDHLTWQKGTFYTHWFRHSDEMLFSTKIVEADRQLNGGENTPALMNELCRVDDDIFAHPHTLQPGYTRDGKKIRLLEAKDNLDDLMMQAYWMSGGDGFEWVEPDQDPAMLMWNHHLHGYNKLGVNAGDEAKSLKWADKLADDSVDKPMA